MIVKEKDKYDFIMMDPPRVQSVRIKTTCFVDVSEIQGREDYKDALISILVLECGDPSPRVISLMGAGGIGKTTLAQLVYNHDKVSECFNKTVWVCVSDVSDEVNIAKGIVEQVSKKASDFNDLQSLLNSLAESLSGQKFLLVLDDVWEEYSNSNKWETLKCCLKSCGGPGSKILVTTRSEVVAKQMGTTEEDILCLGLLSDEDCWSLMSHIAFFDRSDEEREKLQHIGMKIADKCKGLPLAAKFLGSLLRFKDSTKDWENVLNNEIWQLEKAKDDLFPHLLLSYNELSPAMKLCFSYCAVFPKDHVIDVEILIRMWMAQGYLNIGENNDDLELRGKEYFNNLRMRSFFQDYWESFFVGTPYCKMHDIVHDFAQFVSKSTSQNNKVDPNGSEGATTKASSQVCDPLLVSQFSKYRSLICEKDASHFTHLFKSDLRLLRVLESEENIPTDLENLTQLRYLAIYHFRNNHPGRSQSSIPQTIFKLYNLETLNLRQTGIQKIPKEIGNLIKLRHLDLSCNEDIEELPESIYNLGELRTLNVESCRRLKRIPEGIEKLVNLNHFINRQTPEVPELPEGLRKLTRLETLNVFRAGRGRSKLGHLKELNKLSGHLWLRINLDDGNDDIEEAEKAELGNKIHIQQLTITFHDHMKREDEAELTRNGIMEALQPPSSLSSLKISWYEGKKFPGWMSSSLYHLKKLHIYICNSCTALPPLGKLPYLEQIVIDRMDSLELVGREFLGITSSSSEDNNNNNNASQVASSSSSSSTHDHVLVTVFPKLKYLSIYDCRKWKEWEDITTAKEERPSTLLSIMPCLEELKISGCSKLKVLPHRLLHKASSSLQTLEIKSCSQLYEHYNKDKEGSEWNSLISHIPLHVQVELS